MEDKKSSGLVRLSLEAQETLSVMLLEINKIESHLKINNSKLISFIVMDYKERSFEKNKDKIIASHRDRKKEIHQKLKSLSGNDLESLLKTLDKMGVASP
jgi:hypothetical protein